MTKIAVQEFHITIEYPDDGVTRDRQWLEENLELGSAEIVKFGTDEPYLRHATATEDPFAHDDGISATRPKSDYEETP